MPHPILRHPILSGVFFCCEIIPIFLSEQKISAVVIRKIFVGDEQKAGEKSCFASKNALEIYAVYTVCEQRSAQKRYKNDARRA